MTARNFGLSSSGDGGGTPIVPRGGRFSESQPADPSSFRESEMFHNRSRLYIPRTNSGGFGRPLFLQCMIDAAAAVLGLALILAIAGSLPVLFVLMILLLS
jgi:hypothetical protein